MEIQTEVNPYQAPATAAAVSADEHPHAPRRIKFAWFGVFVLNLCAPLFVGWLTTEKGGRNGMFAGVGVLFLAGYWLCTRARSIGRALVVGGLAIGLTQVLPAMQMMAGIVGLCVVSALRLGKPAPDDVMLSVRSDASGFVLTIVTGGLLMAAAFVAGLLGCGLFAAAQRRRSGA